MEKVTHSIRGRIFEFWDCGVLGCKQAHKSKSAAINCIRKHVGIKKKPIMEAEISRFPPFGVEGFGGSNARVRNIISNIERKEKAERNLIYKNAGKMDVIIDNRRLPFHLMSARLKNCLMKDGLITYGDVKNRTDNGLLASRRNHEHERIRSKG